MSRVKVLKLTARRNPLNSLPSMPAELNTGNKIISSIKGLITDIRGHDIPYELEKSDTTKAISSYVANNFGNTSLATSFIPAIRDIAAKLKLPAIATVGVAAAAGLAYLVYKVYTNRESISDAVKKFVEDMKSVAPDLTKIPGWIDSIKTEVLNAFNSDNPASALEKLVRIKDAILGHQKSMNHTNIGSGINFFEDCMEANHRVSNNGSGIKMAVY